MIKVRITFLKVKREKTLKTTTNSWHFDENPQIAKYLTRSVRSKRPITSKGFYGKQIS